MVKTWENNPKNEKQNPQQSRKHERNKTLMNVYTYCQILSN